MVDPRSGTKLKVLVFAASLRTDSLNRKLAALAARIAEQNGATVEHTSMREFDVPSFDGDVGNAQGMPTGAQELRRCLLESDAFIVSSPEYNGSMPGTSSRHGLSATTAGASVRDAAKAAAWSR